MPDPTRAAEPALEPLPEDWQRALVVVAHPDDPEYGLAAAVAVWTGSGKQVSYLLATRGEAGIDSIPPQQCGPLREEEQRRAAAVVGVTDLTFLDHPDGRVEGGLALRRDLARQIRISRPELVVTLNHHDVWGPGAWNSSDHRVVGRATIDAVGDAANRWIFPELLEQGHQPWTGVRHVAVVGSPQPTHAVDVTGSLEAATASLAEHRLYLEALGPRPVAEQARAQVDWATSARSERFGGRPAVAFELFST